MPLKPLILFFIFWIVCLVPLHSQTFPIQINLQQLPPYTPFLSDFTTPGPDRLRITLLLLDTREPRLQIKLKLSIQGNGLNIKSSPSFVTQPIIITPNIPTILTNNDLSGLFDPSQLDFSGISSDNFLKSGKLPEGTYTICAEVFDFIRDETPISDKACSVAFLQELDPPDIISPAAELTPVFPQQFLVSWIPRHIGLFPVEYTTDIIEKVSFLSDQPTGSVGQLLYFGRPLIRYRGPFLNYRISPEDPQLEIGKSYLIRVKVRDPSGRYTFKNDGYSPPHTFTYGKECIAPKITETKLQGNFINIQWRAQAPLTEFDLRYRYKEEPWQSVKVRSDYYNLPIQIIGGKYDFQVGSRCYNQIDVNSDIVSYKLNRKNLPPDFYACGVELELEERSSTPLEELKANDTIVANGMRIILSSAKKNGDGTFSGAGVIGFSLFGKVGIQCNFEGISLNENFELMGGKINITGAGAKLLKDEQLALLDGLIESIKTASDILKIASASASFEYINRFDAFISDDLKDKIDQLLITINNTDNPDAKSKALEELKLIMEDVIEEIEELLDADFQIKFAKNDSQKYGFDGLADQPTDPAMRESYEKTTIAKQNYYIPFKSLEVGQSDVVNAATQNIPDSILQKIYFRTNLNDTSFLSATLNGNSFDIKLPAISEKGEYFVLAAYPDIIHADTDSAKVVSRVAGILKVIVYDRKIKNVVIVPLNGPNPPNPPSGTSAIQNEINKIFNQAVLSWNVTVAPSFTAPGYDGTIDSIHSGFLANYTAEMRNIISSYIQANKEDTVQYYLFVTNTNPGSGLKGFMPRGRNYGFIISTDAKTIAHELAHGYGTLEHTWEVYKKSASGATQYLMDYGDGGLDLMKGEWEKLQNPPGMVPWGQGDKEGELILKTAFYHTAYVYFKYEGQQSCYAALTPTGQKISLPSEAIASFFPTDGGAWPMGSLTGFVLDDKTYLGWWNTDTKIFSGYAPAIDNNVAKGALLPYYSTSLNGCILFAGHTESGCKQAILSDSINPLSVDIFKDSANIVSLLPLKNLSLYEEGNGVIGPCGCYTGECAEFLSQYKDHPYLKDKSILKDVICRNPCLLQAPFEKYDKLLSSKSQWLDEFNQVFGTLLQIGFLPIMADVAGVYFLNALPEILSTKGKDFMLGYVFDLLLQRGIHSVFSPKGQALELDYIQALQSGVESTITLKSAVAGTAISAALECFVSGTFEEGKIRESFDAASCGKAALWAVLVQGGLQVGAYGIKKIPQDVFIDGLIKLFATKDPALYTSGISIDNSSVWKIYKLFHPEITGTDVQHLFKVNNLPDNDDLVKAFADPNIQREFLESGFYLELRAIEKTEAERTEILRDLLARGKLDGDGGKKVVVEWKVGVKEQEFISLAFMPGFNRKSILAIPKGSRPNPNSYLNSDYVLKHMAQFNNGASYLVPKSALDKFGRTIVGRPDGQFVMTKIEMDNLLKNANGALQFIEEELGIPAGLWLNVELVRIDIPDLLDLNPRIPTGNEGGANDLWLPGGKLPKGYSEIVIDPIPAGKYTETLTNIK